MFHSCRVLHGPTRLRFELLRAGASPIQARSAIKWIRAFRAPRFRSFTDPLACASSFCALARSPYKHAAPASGSGVSGASFPVLIGPTRLRFELLRAGAFPIQARSASKWIRRFGRLVSGPSRTHSLALRASARWRVAHTSTQRHQVDPAFRAPRFRSFTDPLACASSFCALARPPYKHAAPASGSRVSVCHRLSICDLSRLSVFRPCSVRVPSVAVHPTTAAHNLRTSLRLRTLASLR